jgi:hypothetical protein
MKPPSFFHRFRRLSCLTDLQLSLTVHPEVCSIPHHERETRYVRLVLTVHPEVYPPSAAPVRKTPDSFGEATRVSKGERDFL